MLKVIQNRLKPQAEAIIAEEQAGFRAGRSTCEQIFNLRVLCEKYAYQQHLYHVFIDFKKAFDRVWHAALWTTMNNYNISHDLICSIKGLYSNATSFQQWIYWRMVSNKCWSKTRVPTIPHAVQHLSRTNYHRRIGWTCRHD